MIKLKDWFLKFYFVFFAILLIDVISYYDKRVTFVFFSALSVAIAAVIGRFFADKINRLSGRFVFCFSAFVILLMTVALVLIGFYMISDPKTDWGVVYQSMQDIISKGHVRTVAVKGDEFSWFATKSYNDYFVIYNNNYFYLSFLTLYYKIVTSFGIDVYSDTAMYAGILLNVFCIDAAVAFGTLAAKKLYGNFGSVIFVLMSALFVPYYIHAYRFYTDSLSMPYPILIILLYICASKNKGGTANACITPSWGFLLA
jgi:hypothetical protein